MSQVSNAERTQRLELGEVVNVSGEALGSMLGQNRHMVLLEQLKTPPTTQLPVYNWKLNPEATLGFQLSDKSDSYSNFSS